MSLFRTFSFLLLSAAAFSLACSTNDHSNHGANHSPNTGAAPAKTGDHAGHDAAAKDPAFTVELKTQPEKVESGKEVELTFTVKDRSGVQVKDFKTVHEKKMHLISVANDLNEFEHLHPDLQADGSFKIKHTFKNGGKYVLYPDATPEKGEQALGRIELMVGGLERTRKELIPETEFKKTEGEVSVEMRSEGEFKSNQNTKLNLVFTDAKSGKPVTDLQNYLGEKAHVVIISEDTKEFLHVHPQSNDVKGETSVSASTRFPKPGTYKVWAQFQRKGTINTVSYVIRVAEGTKETATTAKPENGVVKIIVNEDGYTPSAISVKKGEAVKLVFLRENDKNCGDEVVFSKLNITKKLEVGKEVSVDLTPQEAGEISFACGMNMYKGKVVVE